MSNNHLQHYGRKGMKWGVRNTPTYEAAAKAQASLGRGYTKQMERFSKNLAEAKKMQAKAHEKIDKALGKNLNDIDTSRMFVLKKLFAKKAAIKKAEKNKKEADLDIGLKFAARDAKRKEAYMKKEKALREKLAKGFEDRYEKEIKGRPYQESYKDYDRLVQEVTDNLAVGLAELAEEFA